MALRVACVLALCAAPLSVAVSAGSGFLVAALLGATWQAAQPVVAVLAWLCLVAPYSFVGTTVLSAKGLVRRVFASVAVAAALKVAALLLVRRTGDLELIALASVVVVGVEAAIFVWQVRAAGGGGGVRHAATAMLRTSAAAAAAAGVLYGVVPGTWQVVALHRAPALAAAAATGLLSVVVFAAAQWTLWAAAGRPAGPETLLVDSLRTMPLFQRIRIALARQPQPGR
jgi:O-antigen/teichoic acid export membrane protein